MPARPCAGTCERQRRHEQRVRIRMWLPEPDKQLLDGPGIEVDAVGQVRAAGEPVPLHSFAESKGEQKIGAAERQGEPVAPVEETGCREEARCGQEHSTIYGNPRPIEVTAGAGQKEAADPGPM